jgi:hypothetical protein
MSIAVKKFGLIGILIVGSSIRRSVLVMNLQVRPANLV